MTNAAVVILGAGSGSRVGAEVNKVLLPLAGDPVIAWSVRDALACPGVIRVLVVVREGEQDAVAAALQGAGVDDERLSYITGGATRHASEWHAVQALAEEIDGGTVEVVAIHDAARPWAGAELFERVLEAAAEQGGAIPVLDLVDVASRDGSALPERLVAVQTPQAFRARPLLAAYTHAERDGFAGTDTASCLEQYAAGELRVAAVPGSPRNQKITYAADLGSAG